MDVVLIGIFALVLGAGIGAAVIVATRRPAADAPELADLRLQMAEQSGQLQRLADAEGARRVSDDRLVSGIEHTQRALVELRAAELRRREQEAGLIDLVRRVDTVFAGSRSGRAGENLLEDFFDPLPPGMLLTGYKVNGKTVEFGLRLPDGRCLPIDSKLSAVAEIERLETCEDPAERAKLETTIENAVRDRVREVAKYLDPSLTAPVAVAAVPDPAYSVLRSVHADAFRAGVIVVSYSMALPVLLFLYSLVSRYGEAADVEACLVEVDSLLDSIVVSLENKMAKATTMLQNGSDEIRGYVGKAKGSISRAKALAEDDPELPEAALRAIP